MSFYADTSKGSIWAEWPAVKVISFPFCNHNKGQWVTKSLHPDPIGKRFDFSPPTRVIIERYSIPQITVIARDGGDRQSEAAIHVVFINMTGEPAFLEPTFDTDFTGNTQWAQECE